MRTLKAVQWEHLGIGLEFNFELVLDVVKVQEARGSADMEPGQRCALGQRFGWWPSRQDSSHCGILRVSPQAENMKGIKQSWPECWGAALSKALVGKRKHHEHSQGSKLVESSHRAYPWYLLFKRRRKTVAEPTWAGCLGMWFFGGSCAMLGVRFTWVHRLVISSSILPSKFLLLVLTLRSDIAQVTLPLPGPQFLHFSQWRSWVDRCPLKLSIVDIACGPVGVTVSLLSRSPPLEGDENDTTAQDHS